VTASADLRERLHTVRDQLRGMRDERAEAKKARDKARDAWATAGGKADKTDPLFIAAEASVQRLSDVDNRLGMMQDAERDLLAVLAGGGDGLPAYSFLADPEKVQTLENMASSSTRIPTLGQGGVALGQYLSKEEVAARMGTALQASPIQAALDDSGAPGLRKGTYRGIVPQLRLPLRFLDLIPSIPVENKSYDYAQESGSLDTAREVAEGAVKAQAGAVYTDETAVVRTIAHWIKVNRPTLADVSDLEQRLRDRLTYGVFYRLEKQVIAGDGIGENILGLLSHTGLGSVEFDADELAADQVLEGIVDVLLSGAMPNVVGLSVRDWADILKQKAEGSGEYIGAGPFAAIADVLWGTATVPVPGLVPGQALVGDSRLGGRVLVREGVNVIAGQEQDDMTRNRVTLLGEGRFGLTVDQPSAWAVVELEAVS
jgi:HK97 family phage major capsid protein